MGGKALPPALSQCLSSPLESGSAGLAIGKFAAGGAGEGATGQGGTGDSLCHWVPSSVSGHVASQIAVTAERLPIGGSLGFRLTHGNMATIVPVVPTQLRTGLSIG